MNTRRQTIWLVSMLSLMVLLSAYYLFTQDLDDADKLSDSGLNGTGVTEAGGDGIVVTGAEAGEGMTEEELNALNRQVLEQVEREGLASNGIFGELLAKRDRQNEEEQNRLYAILADVSQNTEQSSAAFAELDQLEEKNERIQTLEDTLMQKYEMALISEENDRYKVVVTSDKMEKKEAAGIIQQVMDVMEVKPSQVSVQYVPNP